MGFFKEASVHLSAYLNCIHYFIFFTDVSSKNLDANERGYALIGKPEDMHTWFFLYDETMRVIPEPTMDNDHAHNNYNVNYGTTSGVGGFTASKKQDMSASLSVPNLDHREATPPNYNYYGSSQHGQPLHAHYIAGGGGGGLASHQQQAQRNWAMYGHSQSVHQATPPTPPMMDSAGVPAPHAHIHHHTHHGAHCGLNQHHSRSVPSVAAAVAQASTGGGPGQGQGGGSVEPYASRNSLNHEISSSSRPQSRNHSHYCQQQGCDYPSG